MSRFRSAPLIAFVSLVAAPVGLVLLWTRDNTAFFRKVFYSLIISGVGVAQAFYYFGWKIEMAGSGLPAFVSYKDREVYERKLDKSRQAPSAPTTAEASSSPAPAKNYWTDYRGPNRLGVYDEMPILTSWPKSGLTRLWKQPVGGGYASFVIAGGLAYTIEQRRDSEVVAAYDVATGKERWTNSWKAAFKESMGGDGPRTTPVYDEGRIYALGAEGELRCLDAATGKVIWNKNMLQENGASNLTWAQAASPLVVEEKLIVLPGGPGGKSVVAYDKMTGKTIWTSQNDEQAYTSPILVTLGGKQQLVVVSALRAMGLTLEEGKLLWEFPWVTEYHVNAAQPLVVGANRFFLSAGYGHGAALVEVSGGGAKAVWRNTKMKNKFSSPVLHEGFIYGLDEGILACLDVNTGDQKWKGGRYGHGQVLLASGHLIVITEEGDLALLKASPTKNEELARFAAIDGKTWNNPAIANGVLLVRNTTEMAAFKIAR